jgi:uncharacterized protein (TIGR00725 family)
MSYRPTRVQVAVVGAGDCDAHLAALAEEVGAGLARAGVVLLTGGRTGVMAAASRGARAAGGLVVGVLPGRDAIESRPNDDVEVALFTGLGQARNVVLVLSAAVVVAVGGSWGTLSEVATALKHGIPVVLLESWRLARPDGVAEPLLHVVIDAAEAVALTLRLAAERTS